MKIVKNILIYVIHNEKALSRKQWNIFIISTQPKESAHNFSNLETIKIFQSFSPHIITI
jgi:hypothetical protein